jgi:hypothetical protein
LSAGAIATLDIMRLTVTVRGIASFCRSYNPSNAPITGTIPPLDEPVLMAFVCIGDRLYYKGLLAVMTHASGPGMY